MHPTTEAKETDPNHVLIAAADEQLAHAHETMRSADEQLTRMQDQLSKLERGTVRSRLRPTRDRPWARGLVALLLAACIFAAALASQSSLGDAVAQRAPQLISALSLSAKKLGFPARVKPTSAQLTAEEPHYAGPTAPTSPEPAQLLQTMARDLANVEREIEQLKASQQELLEQVKASEQESASNNAKSIEQIRASQEQSARDNAKSVELLMASQEHLRQLVARASEQNLRAKASAAQPPPTATATRKPAPTAASPYASARPQAPMQLRPE